MRFFTYICYFYISNAFIQLIQLFHELSFKCCLSIACIDIVLPRHLVFCIFVSTSTTPAIIFWQFTVFQYKFDLLHVKREGAWINPGIWLRPCSELWIDSDHSNDSNIRCLPSSSCSFPYPTKRIFITACLNITYME